MSAEDFYTDFSRAPRSDDPYQTRQLPVYGIVDQQADLPRGGGQFALPQVARRRPPNRSSALLLNVVLALLVLTLLGAGGGLYYLDRSYQGKIYPNISVQGMSLGEMTPAQAETTLRARYADFLRQPMTLTLGDRTWRPTPEELGISFDFKGAINQAYQAGRGNGLIENLQEVAAIWQNGMDLPLRVSFDQRAMQRYVDGIRPELERAPADAQVWIDGVTVYTQPSQIGRQVLVDDTVRDMTTALRTFKPQTVALKMRVLPPRLDDAAVESARAQLEGMLQGPLTLKVDQNQKEYAWSPEEIALMINIARVPASATTDRIAINLNQYQVDRRVRAIADETGRGSVNPRVAWNNGDLKITRPGKPGLRVDETRANEMILAAIGSPERVVALPVREVAPQVTEANLHQLGIDSLISVGKSDFSGSAAYRITNIGVGMNILNGILVAPDEEFSFNENIGSIDEKHGFVEGYAIISNRTQLEFGGGICQDSTTMFRAAFWAGLPITERWGHTFYISWYDKFGPTGMDATIFTGGPDLKFKNDTGHWLLIQSWSDPKAHVAQVEIYGTKLDRQVNLSQKVYNRVPAPTAPVYVADAKTPRGAPHQTDTARGGMTIDIYRTITENGVARKPELFRTKFTAWPNIYTVNPADLGPDGKPHLAPPAPPESQAQPTPAPDQSQPPAEQPTPAPTNG